jgi:hypothetical protein
MARPSIGRLLWASNSTRPHHVGGSRAATWAEKMIYSKISTMSPNPHGKVPDPCIYKSRTPGMVQDLHVGKLDLSDGIRTPLYGVRAAHSGILGLWDREYPCLNQGQARVRSRHMFGLYRIRFRSPPRRRPDAATWPTARDVSQRAEPDVRPLGRAASAFIVDEAHRLSIPLAGDVPPRHLMSPVHSTGRRCAASAFNEPCHSAGRRRLDHPAGGVRVHSIGRRHVHTTACATLIMTRALPRKQPRHINTVWTTDIMALGDRPGDTGISYFLPFCPWAHMSGLNILVCAPLSYKREDTRRYKAHSLRPNSSSQLHLDSDSHSLIHSSSQTQYNRQWSRVLRYGGLYHSKPLCVLVFVPNPLSRQNA